MDDLICTSILCICNVIDDLPTLANSGNTGNVAASVVDRQRQLSIKHANCKFVNLVLPDLQILAFRTIDNCIYWSH